MEFIFKREAVVVLDKIISLKGHYPINSLFLGFPKKVVKLSTVLNEEKQGTVYVKAFSKEIVKRKLPKTIEDKVHYKFANFLEFNIGERFVLFLKNARVAFEDCFVITQNGLMIEELNPLMGRGTSPIFYKSKMPFVNKVSGKVGVISNSDNYFHWMFETIPRVLLLEKIGAKPDYYVVGENKSFKKESLKKLGLPQKKIIPACGEMHILADELIVPSPPIHTGNPTPAVCQFLRKTFLTKTTKDYSKKYEKIYVQRGSSVQSRKVVNENEVIDFLSKKGFRSVVLDGLSIEEQAKIFSSAKVVIAFHGAALSNLVFCKKGTKVIEFFNPDYVNVCFWALSNCVNLDYYYFITRKASAFDMNLNVILDLDKLLRTLKLIGID
jgi:hypothetical protein